MEISVRSRQLPETFIEFAEPRAESFRHTVSVLLDRTIFSALLALIALIAVAYGAVEPWWESIFECVIFALTALWIVEGLLSGSWRMGNYHLLMPLSALAIFAFWQSCAWGGATVVAGIESRTGTALSAAPYETWRFVLKLLALALTGALLQSHITGPRRFNALIKTLIFVGVASALFGIVRQTTQHEEGFLLAFLRPGEGYAQFINRNHFAFLMEMAFGLALGLVTGRGARRDRVMIYAAAMILMWTGLVLSNSRGGIGSLLSQILFTALIFGFVRRQSATEKIGGLSVFMARIGQSAVARFVIVICLMLVMGVGIIWMGGDPLVNRLETLPSDLRAASPSERASENRVEIWQATWRLFKAHPFAGSGFGAYAVAIPAFHDSSGEMTPREAHNDYLELLASGGLIGGLIGLWFVIAFIKRAREQFRDPDPFRRSACFGALIGIFGAATHSLFDFGLHITVNALVLTALVVIATIDGKALRKHETATPARPLT